MGLPYSVLNSLPLVCRRDTFRVAGVVKYFCGMSPWRAPNNGVQHFENKTCYGNSWKRNVSVWNSYTRLTIVVHWDPILNSVQFFLKAFNGSVLDIVGSYHSHQDTTQLREHFILVKSQRPKAKGKCFENMYILYVLFVHTCTNRLSWFCYHDSERSFFQIFAKLGINPHLKIKLFHGL